MKQRAISFILCLAIVSSNTQTTTTHIAKLIIIEKPDDSDYKCNYYNYSSDNEYVVLSQKQVNWFQAVQMCEENGMELASVLNDADNEKLRMVLERNLPSGYAWVYGAKVDYDYTWMRSNQKVTYTRWASGNPIADANAMCLCIGKDATWYNYYCHTKYYPVCQLAAHHSITRSLNKIKQLVNSCM